MERALNELGEGIVAKEIDLNTKKVSVTYNDGKVSANTIKKAIKDAGYDVEE